MTLACSRLEDLFDGSTPGVWGQTKAGKGLLLIGIKSEDSSLVSRVTNQAANHGEDYKMNLGRVLMEARGIVDKSLPDNGLIIDSMPYRTKRRSSWSFV